MVPIYLGRNVSVISSDKSRLSPHLLSWHPLLSGSLWALRGHVQMALKVFFWQNLPILLHFFHPLVLYLFSCDKSRSLCNCWAAILFSPTSTSPLWGFRQFVSVAEFFFPLWCGLIALLNNLHMVVLFYITEILTDKKCWLYHKYTQKEKTFWHLHLVDNSVVTWCGGNA